MAREGERMECKCFGGGRPVHVPDPRNPRQSAGVAFKFTNRDCPVHGKDGKKKGNR